MFKCVFLAGSPNTGGRITCLAMFLLKSLHQIWKGNRVCKPQSPDFFAPSFVPLLQEESPGSLPCSSQHFLGGRFPLGSQLASHSAQTERKFFLKQPKLGPFVTSQSLCCCRGPMGGLEGCTGRKQARSGEFARGSEPRVTVVGDDQSAERSPKHWAGICQTWLLAGWGVPRGPAGTFLLQGGKKSEQRKHRSPMGNPRREIFRLPWLIW